MFIEFEKPGLLHWKTRFIKFENQVNQMQIVKPGLLARNVWAGDKLIVLIEKTGLSNLKNQVHQIEKPGLSNWKKKPMFIKFDKLGFSNSIISVTQNSIYLFFNRKTLGFLQ